MKMRTLNTLAGGVASGYGAGSQISNRNKLTSMEGERLGIAKDRLKMESDYFKEMSDFMQKWAPNVAGTVSATQQPVPDAQSFAQNNASMLQGPPQASPFAAQPGLAANLMQPPRRQLPVVRLPLTDI